jgi:hypothetical protein
MVWPSFLSVVRLLFNNVVRLLFNNVVRWRFNAVRVLVVGLLSLGVIACTAQHTQEVGRKMLQDVGLKSSIAVTRTGQWSLPSDTAVHLAPVTVVGADQEAYPRLRYQLNGLLEALAAEKFRAYRLEDAVPETGAGVLLRVGLVSASENLSSAVEILDRRGLSSGESGRDQLHVVMRVYDLRTGQLLDTLTTGSVSGWRWSEHQVAELAEPALRAMLDRLRGAQVVARAE